jgi:hypothetical protein
MTDQMTLAAHFPPTGKRNYTENPAPDGILAAEKSNAEARVQNAEENPWGEWEMQGGYPNFESDQHTIPDGEVIETEGLQGLKIEPLLMVERGGEEWRVVNSYTEVFALLPYDSAPPSLTQHLSRESAYEKDGKRWFILGPAKVGDAQHVREGLPCFNTGMLRGMTLYFPMCWYSIPDAIALTKRLRGLQVDTPQKLKERLAEVERKLA